MMEKHLIQAQRNKELSAQPYNEGKFLEWANTTAFYSALHYVSYKVFPKVYNGVMCGNINDICNVLRISNKHEAMVNVVNIQLPKLSMEYKFLLDSSMTARYYDYNTHKEQAKICQKFLQKIKAECENK